MTYGFNYKLYVMMFGHEDSGNWPKERPLAECDSMFLGCLVDPDMKCPKCGEFAFPERTA